MNEEMKELVQRARKHLTLMDDEQQATGNIDHGAQLAWVNTFGRPFLEFLESLELLLSARETLRHVDRITPERIQAFRSWYTRIYGDVDFHRDVKPENVPVEEGVTVQGAKTALVGTTDGVVDQCWDAEGRPLDPDHPAGVYVVCYPGHYAHSEKRLKAILDKAGDTMAYVIAVQDHPLHEILDRDTKPANVLPPMAGYCSKGHVVRGTIDKCGQIRCEPCGALVTPYPYCRAGRDGDCNWEACPQIVGPYQQHCPLDGPNPAEDIDEHECGCHPFIENCAPESETEDCICACHNTEVHNFRRASGDQPCPVCKRPYREHPLGGRRCMGDKRFLRRLCNGQLVKL